MVDEKLMELKRYINGQIYHYDVWMRDADRADNNREFEKVSASKKVCNDILSELLRLYPEL